MAHIKKKFTSELALKPEVQKTNLISVPNQNTKPIRIPKGEGLYMETESETFVQCFQITLNGINYIIPEPDPVLIHFNHAYTHFKLIEVKKKELLKSINGQTIYTETIKNNAFVYFGFCKGFVIFLFTSIEAFINKKIPEDYIFQVLDNRRTESYNKDQIQRFLPFDMKLKKILPQISKKDFAKDFSIKFQHIHNLKEFRDMLIHTKTDSDGITLYDHIFKKCFSFKYEETLSATRDFLNYYQHDYIQDCDCGKDY